MEDKPRFSTLFILGLGHSGSTLLGRMLGCHPDVVFVGEVLRTERVLTHPGERCSCGASVAECPVWQHRAEFLPEAVKTNFRHWTLEMIEGLRKSENKALLVDSSKSRVLRLKSRWESPQVGYVLMVRDPRGALRSALQYGRSLQELLSRSGKWMRRFEEFVQQHPSVSHTMFYEDLMASPETELGRVCEFIGLGYVPEMCHPDRKVFHVLGSNSAYLKGADRLKLDERWQSALTPEQLEAISHHLGKLPIYRERYKLGRI